METPKKVLRWPPVCCCRQSSVKLGVWKSQKKIDLNKAAVGVVCCFLQYQRQGRGNTHLSSGVKMALASLQPRVPVKVSTGFPWYGWAHLPQGNLCIDYWPASQSSGSHKKWQHCSHLFICWVLSFCQEINGPRKNLRLIYSSAVLAAL